MQDLSKNILRFLKDEEGAELIEFSMTAGILVAGLVAIFLAIGGKLTTIFTFVDTEIGINPNA